MSATCVRCTRPMPDSAYVCADDARALAEVLLTAAGHAEDAETVIARQARPGAGTRGGSSDGLNYDATRSRRWAAIANAIGGWARIVTEETGRRPRWRPMAGPMCAPVRPGDEPRDGNRCAHDSCVAIRRRDQPGETAGDAAWLAQRRQVDFLRKHPAADEAFSVLHDACADLARLIDVPADNEIVGMCDCGKVLYAPRHRTHVQCPVKTCALRWNVVESRDILRKALDGKLVTAAEAARLAAFLDTDRNQEQIRKLINGWARTERRLIEAHGHVVEDDGVDENGIPKTKTVDTYRFGDISDRLARTPRRTPRAEVAA